MYSEDKRILKALNKAIDNIEKDPFSGIQIPKRLIPKRYNKVFKPDNLWKYDLNRSWRLIYWIASDDEGRITLLIDWMDHKEYDKIFGYRSS
ncbi:MAG: type II toxin-antitoxin system YoeB family toxin [Methanomicrobiaceae archaeon]|nr:type II toxin-antitoxin system YoeB family toxin [Methanomicrobiaceae archaeon]